MLLSRHRSMGVQVAGCVAVFSFALPQAAAAHPGRSYWSEQKLMATVGGTVIHIKGKRVRVARALLACMGEGRGVIRRAVRRWKHFWCIQPTFPRGVLV